MNTAFELVRQAATRTPDHLAIIDSFAGGALSYRELVTAIETTAGTLRSMGIEPTDRVACVSANRLDYAVAILALHRLGAVPALMNPRLKPQEIAALVQRGSISAAVTHARSDMADALRAVVPRDKPVVQLEDLPRTQGGPVPAALDARPDDAAFIFYTSGTTGLPKGVVIPQRATEPRVLFMATQAGHRHGAHNRVIGLMPLYHVVGFYAVLLMSLAFNGTYYVVSEFSPRESIDLIARKKITSVFGTPTHFAALLSTPLELENPFASLEHVTFAGATMPDSLLSHINEKLPGLKVNIYGTTEAMNSLYMPAPEIGAVVQPGFNSEARIVRIGGKVSDTAPAGIEGEIIVRAGDATFTHYLNDPSATTSKLHDGWYRTSDIGMLDRDGNIIIKGRADDTIISGGENIHPNEVESILAEHPGIAELAVVGVFDERWGEKVVACVVRADPNCSTDDLDAFCRRSRLADFKRPKGYVFLETLPKNAMNKVLRATLKKLAVSILSAGTRISRA